MWAFLCITMSLCSSNLTGQNTVCQTNVWSTFLTTVSFHLHFIDDTKAGAALASVSTFPASTPDKTGFSRHTVQDFSTLERKNTILPYCSATEKSGIRANRCCLPVIQTNNITNEPHQDHWALTHYASMQKRLLSIFKLCVSVTKIEGKLH
jgi:hypothetical protein